jgi:hypothetical protein
MANPGPAIEGQPMVLAPAGVGRSRMTFAVNLAALANADLITNRLFNFKGRILAVNFLVLQAAVAGGKAATLTVRLVSGGVPVSLTGGVVALTSANCTPAGVTVPGTAVTGLNLFGAADGLTVTGSAVTAFTEGAGQLEIDIVNDDTLNTLARQGILFNINP